MFKYSTVRKSRARILAGPALRAFALVLVSGLLSASCPAATSKIALIGNLGLREPAGVERSHRVARLGANLRAAPVFAGSEIVVYPLGWPTEPSALSETSTLVLCFGAGENQTPFLAPEQLAQLQRLIDARVGVVCLFQAPALGALGSGTPLRQWLGLRGDSDFQALGGPVSLLPAQPGHPVCAGVATITSKDEVRAWRELDARAVPVLRAARSSSAAGGPGPSVAWVLERQDGGRSFAFTGGPSSASFEDAPLVQFLLNAIAWTEKLAAPSAGVLPVPPVVGRAVVTKAADCKPLPQTWGELVWYTSAAQGNSRTMTTGLAVILPGKSNPLHFHPNCDEVLHVIQGRIIHTMDGESAEMKAGDTVSIPVGTLHNATNVGNEVALLSIAFSSAYRQVIGYK